MGMVLGAIALFVIGVGLYVRLAPSDPARWNVSPAPAATPDCTVEQGAGDARATCLLPGPPAEALAKLDAIARATPRTTRLTLHARLRFGRSDMGVNAARLRDWLSGL